MPMKIPGQGRSEFTGSLNMWKASSRGMPQVELGTRMEGMALPYPSIRPFHPPTSAKPQSGDKRVSRSVNLEHKVMQAGGFSHINSLKPMRERDPPSMMAV